MECPLGFEHFSFVTAVAVWDDDIATDGGDVVDARAGRPIPSDPVKAVASKQAETIRIPFTGPPWLQPVEPPGRRDRKSECSWYGG